MSDGRMGKCELMKLISDGKMLPTLVTMFCVYKKFFLLPFLPDASFHADVSRVYRMLSRAMKSRRGRELDHGYLFLFSNIFGLLFNFQSINFVTVSTKCAEVSAQRANTSMEEND